MAGALPSAMYRGTLLTTHGGGYNAATAAPLAAVASRARGGCVGRVAHSMDASIVPRMEREAVREGVGTWQVLHLGYTIHPVWEAMCLKTFARHSNWVKALAPLQGVNAISPTGWLALPHRPPSCSGPCAGEWELG